MWVTSHLQGFAAKTFSISYMNKTIFETYNVTGGGGFLIFIKTPHLWIISQKIFAFIFEVTIIKNPKRALTNLKELVNNLEIGTISTLELTVE